MATLFSADDDKIKQEDEASRASGCSSLDNSTCTGTISTEEEEGNGGFVQPPITSTSTGTGTGTGTSTIPEKEQERDAPPLDELELELKPSRSLTTGETTFAGDIILDAAQVTTAVASSPQYQYQDQPPADDDDANSMASADSSTAVVVAAVDIDVDIQETTAESTIHNTCPKDDAAVPTTTAETSSSGYSWASWLVFW